MKWIYVMAGIALFIKMLIMPNPTAEWTEMTIAESIVGDAGVSNAVSGIIFRNRLYDTIFEVVVFTIAVLGVGFLLADEQPTHSVDQFNDRPSIVLARLGATIAAIISIELAIRGHLSPGGGFAAGVAGGTAIGLIAITSSSEMMESIYKKWRISTWEKSLVIGFIIFAALTLSGLAIPQGQLGTLFSGGIIPILNILVAAKVALGSWAVILLFIRYRGLL
ncbi:MAG: Na(+)/H(+) antiporter subunit B [Pleurocapsa sp.]